jgi:MFS family permease
MTTSSAAPKTTRLAVPKLAERRWQRSALPLLFGLLGLVFAAWASRIPAVRDALHLTPGRLGFALLCAGVGGLASFPLAAWMVARYGQARAAVAGGAALLLALCCIGFATNLPMLMAALGLLGAAASCFDVAINAIGAVAEKKAGRSIMSMLHAWFCVGTVTGALTGSLLASLGIPPHDHFTLLSAVMALPLWLAYRSLKASIAADGSIAAAQDPVSTQGAAARYRLPPRHLMVLGLLGFCGAIAEGGVADWSGVFMRDEMGATAGLAPLGYAGFSGAMLVARVFADRLKDRFGARRVVAGGGMLAVAGIVLAVVGLGVPLTIAGFALTGAGLAGVFPFVFSAAGREGPTALAGVATISYCGALAGPPVIGFIAQFAGLQAALGCLGGLCATMAVIASRAKSLS